MTLIEVMMVIAVGAIMVTGATVLYSQAAQKASDQKLADASPTLQAAQDSAVRAFEKATPLVEGTSVGEASAQIVAAVPQVPEVPAVPKAVEHAQFAEAPQAVEPPQAPVEAASTSVDSTVATAQATTEQAPPAAGQAGQSLGQVADQLQGQMEAMLSIISTLGMIGGMIMFAVGILQLKKAVDGDGLFGAAMSKLGAGALLLAVPSIIPELLKAPKEAAKQATETAATSGGDISVALILLPLLLFAPMAFMMLRSGSGRTESSESSEQTVIGAEYASIGSSLANDSIPAGSEAAMVEHMEVAASLEKSASYDAARGDGAEEPAWVGNLSFEQKLMAEALGIAKTAEETR